MYKEKKNSLDWNNWNKTRERQTWDNYQKPPEEGDISLCKCQTVSTTNELLFDFFNVKLGSLLSVSLHILKETAS